MTATRSCGGCSACCIAPEIPALKKAAGERCIYLRPRASGGEECGIYDARPSTCRNFRCVWLDGLGMNSERPDRLEMLTYEGVDNAVKLGELCYTAIEVCPGAFSNFKVRLFLDELTLRLPVLLVKEDGSGSLVKKRAGK